MERIRILHVLDSFGTGGAEAGVRKLLAGLDSDVFVQTVCTVAPYDRDWATKNVRFISLDRVGNRRQLLVRKLKQVFDQEHPHIVHSRNWSAIEAVLAARLAKVCGVVHSEHGLELPSFRGQPWRRNVVRSLCFAAADRVFAVSEALRSYYVQHLWVRRDRIGVIANGVDVDRYRLQPDLRESERRRLGVAENTLVIGTVSRLDPIKDHRTLLVAVDRLLASGVRARLVIVGDGPERKKLEEDVRARELLGRNTVFTGNSHDVVSHLNGFDVFVLPSLAEGMCNALLEAMSTGVACVATNVGGNPELIEDGRSGLLFQAGDAQALTAQLKDLASNPERRRELGFYGRKRIDAGFSLQRMLSAYTRLYESVVSKRRGVSETLSRVHSMTGAHD